MIQERAKRAKKIGANTRADTSSLGSLRKIKGNRATKERGNTFFIDLGLFIVTFKQYNIVPDLKFSMFFPAKIRIKKKINNTLIFLFELQRKQSSYCDQQKILQKNRKINKKIVALCLINH